jgi:hypothetical protein
MVLFIDLAPHGFQHYFIQPGNHHNSFLFVCFNHDLKAEYVALKLYIIKRIFGHVFATVSISVVVW